MLHFVNDLYRLVINSNFGHHTPDSLRSCVCVTHINVALCNGKWRKHAEFCFKETVERITNRTVLQNCLEVIYSKSDQGRGERLVFHLPCPPWLLSSPGAKCRAPNCSKGVAPSSLLFLMRFLCVYGYVCVYTWWEAQNNNFWLRRVQWCSGYSASLCVVAASLQRFPWL